MRAKPANPVRPCPRGGRAWSHRLGQCMLEKEACRHPSRLRPMREGWSPTLSTLCLLGCPAACCDDRDAAPKPGAGRHRRRGCISPSKSCRPRWHSRRTFLSWPRTLRCYGLFGVALLRSSLSCRHTVFALSNSLVDANQADGDSRTRYKAWHWTPSSSWPRPQGRAPRIAHRDAPRPNKAERV